MACVQVAWVISHSNGTGPSHLHWQRGHAVALISWNFYWQSLEEKPSLLWLPLFWPFVRAWRPGSASWLGAPMEKYHTGYGCWIKRKSHLFPPPLAPCSFPPHILTLLWIVSRDGSSVKNKRPARRVVLWMFPKERLGVTHECSEWKIKKQRPALGLSGGVKADYIFVLRNSRALQSKLKKLLGKKQNIFKEKKVKKSACKSIFGSRIIHKYTKLARHTSRTHFQTLFGNVQFNQLG